jgi:hypothetical protein
MDDDDDQYAYAKNNPMLAHMIEERDQAFLSTDYSWAEKRLRIADPDITDSRIQQLFHRARTAWTNCPPELKEASERFLATNGRMDA